MTEPARLRQPRPGNRAVIYVRQSQEKEGSESLENQEYLAREYCRQRGYEVIDVQRDRITGRKWDKRPGVIATLQLIEDHRADVIVLWKWSRLSRSRIHWPVVADRIERVGGRIESVTEPIDTATASGKFSRDVMIGYAAFQSDQIGEVWREQLERRLRKGLPGTGRGRFGYIRDREADTYTPHPDEVPVVRELYRRYIGGTGMASLARWLNDNGHKTRTGGPWQAVPLQRYLDHGFAAGLLWSKGEFYPGAHEPIIDQETWDAYRARRAGTTRHPRGTVRMLSGLMRCGTCGGPMTVARSSGETGHYACAAITRGLRTCPARNAISRSNVERFVAEWITSLPSRLDDLREAAKRQTEQQVRAIDDRAAIARMIARTETRLSNLTMKLVDDRISQAAYDATAEKLNADLQSLRERYVRSAPMPKSNPFDAIPAMVDGWDVLDPAARNRVARALIARVVINRPVARGPNVWRERITIVPRWKQDD